MKLTATPITNDHIYVLDPNLTLHGPFDTETGAAMWARRKWHRFVTITRYQGHSWGLLREVDLSTAEDHGQLNLFNNECEGMCGV